MANPRTTPPYPKAHTDVTLVSAAYVQVGQTVIGTGIDTGSTVVSVSGLDLVISKPTTATIIGGTLQFLAFTTTGTALGPFTATASATGPFTQTTSGGE